MSMLEILKSRRKEILNVAAKFGAHDVRVFGSVARGESRRDSDVDFLVEMEQGRSLLDLIGLEDELGELLHRPVDVITVHGVSPYISKQVLSEAVAL